AALVDPGRLEEAPVMIAAEDRVARLVEDLHVARRLGEGLHVRAHARDLGAQRRLVVLLQVARADRRIVPAARPVLQLATPDAAEVHVELPVGVLEYVRIHREAARDRLGLGLEWAHRRAAAGDAYAEYALFVLGREVQVIGAVLARRVGRPHLLAGPRHVGNVERDRPDRDRPADRIHRQHAVVAHRVLTAEV